MSASAREPESPRPVSDEPSDGSPKGDAHRGDAASGNRSSGPTHDTPKTARQTQPRQEPTRQNLNTPPADARTEAPEPPWRHKRPPRAFAGDVAMAELRNDLADVPDDMSEPPAPEPPISNPWVLGAKGLIVVATATAAGVVAYLWSSPNASDRIDVASAARELPASLDSGQQPRAAPTAQPSPAPVSALRSFFSQSDEASARERARQLTIKAARLWQVDGPARVIVSPADGNLDVDVVISGLAPGSAVSIGTSAGPNRWRLPLKDLNRAAITPPQGFVGIMDLIMELHLANDTVIDRKDVLLEWSHNSRLATASFPPRQLDAAEIKLMVKSGLEFMANGNVGAARLMFLPAAEAGDAVAAFALAETYDPLVLKKLGTRGGITADVVLANSWYERAGALGSMLARERLERLARGPE
jgi:hypothetical protein